MTTKEELTDEQARVAGHPGSLYVKACPGAGKTRALVARAQKLADVLPPTRGLALLSFTNSAAEEFRERLIKAGASSLLRPPHFVGTIDSFLGRFVVLPRGNPFAPEQPIQHVEGWRRHTVRVFTGQKTAYGKPDLRTVNLSAFLVSDVEPNTGRATTKMDFDLVAREHGRGLATQLQQLPRRAREKAESTAAKTLASIMSRGYLSPAEVRLLATNFLMAGDEQSRAHLRNLVERFPHLVVDEAQDCDTVILSLLGQLSELGSEMTLIGDPDQCIYTWRGADPKGLVRMSRNWRVGPRLTGNFRSSPSICRAAATLKEVSEVDVSRGDSANCAWPIYVAPLKMGKPFVVGQLFLNLLEEKKVEVANAIVLAPSWSLARAVAGAEPPASTHQRLGGKLRAACYSARERPDSKSIGRVRELVEQHLNSRLPIGMDETQDRTRIQQLKDEARRLAHEVLSSNPTGEEWYDHTVEVLDTFRPPSGLACIAEARKFLPKPSKPLEVEIKSTSGLSFSSVHQAKGREYEAVLYAAGLRVDDKLKEFLADWKVRKAGSESRAVAYVAVSRAKRLLLFCGPRKVCGEVRSLLKRNGAAVEFLEIDE